MGSLHWLYPLFFFGVLAAAVPVVLHLLRGRASRPLPLPTIRFLKAQASASRFHWIQRWFVLFCRVAVFALLAAAFARPYLTAYFTGGRATVIVVDNSFSMQATGRAEKLRAFGLRELGDGRPHETVGVLQMNPHPRWLVPMTPDTAMVRRALASAEPGWEVTRIEPAVRLAADVLAVNPAQERRLIVLTDHQRSGWIGADFARKLPPGIKVIFPPAEAAPARQAFVRSATVVLLQDETAVVEVMVAAAGSAAQKRTVRLFADDSEKPFAEVAMSLSSGETTMVRHPLPPEVHPRWVRVALDPDDLPADDVAFAVAPVERFSTNRVLLDPSTGGEFDFLRVALSSMTSLKPRFAAELITPTTSWNTPAALVLRSATSFKGEGAARLDAFLSAGGSALVFVDSEVAATPWWHKAQIELSKASAGPDELSIREWTAEHPLVAPLARRGMQGLVGWRFLNARALPPSVVDPIAFWSDGSIAIGEARAGNGRVVICGFSAGRRDGDFPTESAFVPFVHRTLAYLVAGEVTQPARRFRIGESVVLPPVRGKWRAVAGPATDEPVRTVEGAVSPQKPGVYVFEYNGEHAIYAVNVAPEESDLTPWADGTPWSDFASPENAERSALSKRSALAAADAEQRTGLWSWCFLAAAGLMLVELTVANRTTR